ncbi:MAG: nickel pincer cofactor biosynthesis protein LarB, partial [Geminicoccales bacterium]
MAPEIDFDFDRPERIGLSEAVLCLGKTPAQIAEVIAMAETRDLPLLLTRLEPAMFAALAPRAQAVLDYDPPSRTAAVGAPRRPEGDPLV